MLKVVHHFTDLQDDNHAYFPGDKYPRSGYEPTKARIEQLSGSRNRQGKPLIIEEKGNSKAESLDTAIAAGPTKVGPADPLEKVAEDMKKPRKAPGRKATKEK